jgi:hypothetical protein
MELISRGGYHQFPDCDGLADRDGPHFNGRDSVRSPTADRTFRAGVYAIAGSPDLIRSYEMMSARSVDELAATVQSVFLAVLGLLSWFRFGGLAHDARGTTCGGD